MAPFRSGVTSLTQSLSSIEHSPGEDFEVWNLEALYNLETQLIFWSQDSADLILNPLGRRHNAASA